MLTIVRGLVAVGVAVSLAACSAEPPAAEPAKTPSATHSPAPAGAPLKTPATHGKCRVGCDTVKARDYNGDGYADLAIGAPGLWSDEEDPTVSGYVVVSYGGPDGLGTHGRNSFQPGREGLPGVAAKGDSFGAVLAGGDFDRDGYADLAVGTNNERADSPASVTIVFGGEGGLSGRSTVRLTHEDPAFGQLLAAGDFDGDGYQDLGVATDAAVWVVYGGSRIRQRPPRPRLLKKSSAINALASGDVTGDGVDDLVVAFSDDDPADEGTGAVYRGSSGGLTGVAGPTFDAWGVGSMSVGDVNGDGFGDVIAGNSYADAADPGGQIFIYRGSATGPEAKGVLVSQSSPGVPKDPEDSAGFGGNLAVGDINGDGYADVAVSASRAVFLLYGGKDRLPDAGAQLLKPGDVGITQDVQSFGAALRLSDFNKDGQADLALGVLTEPVVAVLAGSPEGVSTAKPTLINPGQAATPGKHPGFGRALN
ncbi:FG-GAP-like repeat-containing protein [Nonomuraea sp. NPDC049028]|uniref:FG-GAP-like repeat-containing protein n=1 Tax=Nonomuraea sp. NPDC049028 TaxID=3364348 RepID=UPI00371E21C3